MTSLTFSLHSLVKRRPGPVELRLYDDQRVLHIKQGRAFLDYLCAEDIHEMLATIADAGLLSAEDEERDRTIEDLRDLKAMSQAWHDSVDTGDGSLRLYCD